MTRQEEIEKATQSMYTKVTETLGKHSGNDAAATLTLAISIATGIQRLDERLERFEKILLGMPIQLNKEIVGRALYGKDQGQI